MTSGGSAGSVVPGPRAEQRQPDPGEDAGRARCRPRRGRTPRPSSCGRRRPGRRRGAARRTPRSWSRGRPGPRRTSPTCRRRAAASGSSAAAAPRQLVGCGSPRNSAEEQVLGVHRDVGLELALPPPAGSCSASSASRPRPSAAPTSRRAAAATVTTGAPRRSAPARSARPHAPWSRSRGPRARERGVEVRARRALGARPRPPQRFDELPRPRAISGSVGVPFARSARSSRRSLHRRALPARTTTGSVFFCWRRSLQTGLPVTAGLAPDAEQVVDGLEREAEVAAVRRRAPRPPRRGHRPAARRCDAAQASSAPVLPASMAMHSSRETSSRVSNAMSTAWPAIIALVAAASADAAAGATGRAGVEQDLRARASRRASPAMMASPTPNSAHTVGRCRRSRSSSMTSSWSSEKLWTSSMATAPGTPDRGRRARAPRPRASRARAGRPCRRRPPTGLPSTSAQPRW